AAERPLKDIRDEYNYPKKKGIKDECSRLLEASTMKSRRGFAIQRLMNAMRQAHADGWFIVFDTLTLADDRLEAFYDNPNALRDYFRDIGRMVLAAEGRKANDSHADCYQYFCVRRQIAINGHIKFNLTIPLQQLNGLETLGIIMVANKYAFLQITRRRFLNEWEAFKKVISRRSIRRRITIPLTLSNLKLLRRITRTENILHRNFTRRQVAIQNRVASNIGISQSTFSVKVLNLFSRSRRKTNKRKSKHSAMLRNKETRHRMF